MSWGVSNESTRSESELRDSRVSGLVKQMSCKAALEKLNKIRRNWAKAPNRHYSTKWFVSKEDEIKQAINQCDVNENLLCSLVTLSERELCRKLAKELLTLFKTYKDKNLDIESSSDSETQEEPQERLQNMASQVSFRDVEQSLARFDGV